MKYHELNTISSRKIFVDGDIDEIVQTIVEMHFGAYSNIDLDSLLNLIYFTHPRSLFKTEEIINKVRNVISDILNKIDESQILKYPYFENQNIDKIKISKVSLNFKNNINKDKN